MTRPGIGTAQLGLPYGAYQNQGLMPEGDAEAILSHTHSAGITFIDTARAYGESEKRIGNYLRKHDYQGLTLCSKFPRVHDDIWHSASAYQNAMNEAFRMSADLLYARISIMLLHQCEIPFLSTKHIQQYFADFKDQNPSIELGISIYSIDEAQLALSFPWVSWLQCPINLIDHRFIEQKFIERCRAQSVGIIARSIFLQGVLSSITPLPTVSRAKELGKLRKQLSMTLPTQPLEQSAISFIFGHNSDNIAVGIFGIHAVHELVNNMSAVNTCTVFEPHVIQEIRSIAVEAQELNLHDPRTWNR